MERDEKSMNDKQLTHNSEGAKARMWPLAVIFLLLAVGIGISGYLYNDKQRENIKKAKQEQLSTIADLKVREIVNWRKERRI